MHSGLPRRLLPGNTIHTPQGLRPMAVADDFHQQLFFFLKLMTLCLALDLLCVCVCVCVCVCGHTVVTSYRGTADWINHKDGEGLTN